MGSDAAVWQLSLQRKLEISTSSSGKDDGEHMLRAQEANDANVVHVVERPWDSRVWGN